MAPKISLNAQNLEALGAKRLAELLIEIGDGNAAVKRRLRLALAGAQSPAEASREIRKRLSAISRSRTFVDWQNRRALVEDLETQRRAIVDHVAKTDPKEALELMWSFMGLASSVFARCDDGSGTVIGIFHEGVSDLGRLAEAAKADKTELADRTYQALLDNEYGQFDRLIAALRPALGDVGLEQLKQRFIALSKEPVKKPKDQERRKVGWSMSGPIYEDDIDNRHRASVIHLALREIADAQGDVDAFVAQYDAPTRKVPKIAAEIARRLLAAGRADEALRIVEAAERSRPGWPEFEWEDARIDVLDAFESAGRRAGCALVLLRTVSLGAPLARLSEAATRFRRHRSRKTRARLRRGLQEPAARAVFLGDLACIGSRGETRRGSSGRAEWRSLRGLDSGRRISGRQISIGGDARATRDDRVCARSKQI